MSINWLIEKSKQLNRLKVPSVLFEELGKIDTSILKELEILWQPNQLFQPVVLLRYIIILKLQKGERINQMVIDEIKEAIESRNISLYCSPPPVYLKSLAEYKLSSSGMFHQWKEPFLILFPFFYSQKEREEAKQIIIELGNDIIEKKSILNAKIHPVDFYGSNNYGADVVWFAIIPKQAFNVQKAYQLFVQISKDGINGGLYKGYQINAPEFKQIDSKYNTWDDYLLGLDSIIPNWKEYNEKIDFSIQKDEKDLKSRIKKSDRESVLFLFDSIDKLLSELSIPNEDKLVFSTSSGNLSFQIGKRYCISLRKDKFSFITPGEYSAKNLENTKFGGPDTAIWNHKATISDVKEHFLAIANAVQFEFERDKATEPKEYDNAAFRLAVFDKEYRDGLFEELFGIKTNFWVFQGSPEIFDFDKAIRNNLLEDWTVSAHKDKIKVGDKVILWIIGKKAGCYALAEITKEPQIINDSKDEHLWKTDHKRELKAGIKITHNLIDNPILSDSINETEGLENLKVGSRGSNFSATKTEYNTLLKLIKMQQEDQNSINQIPLNQILFGPPGTGKTYHTVTEAIKIVDKEYFLEHSENRKNLQKRFNELYIEDWNKADGQIAFCTFHQSFSYEDFVEGIKPLAPKENETYLKYDIVAGIFKNICRLADASNNAKELVKDNLVSLTQSEFNSAVFYKISLGDSTKSEDKEIYDYCINNNVIAIGFGEGIDFTGKDETEVNKIVADHKYGDYIAQAVNYFKNYLKNGNYVVVSNGNNYVRALGVVEGDYTFEASSEIGFNHFRKVRWIFNNVEIPVSEFYQKKLSQQTIYKLKSEFIIPSFFLKQSKPEEQNNELKKFVLIVDEINRGNVSSIFGELITLIEITKRTGMPESLKITLPYSKTPFSVPSNVYIIGTMNTADRSIESLDTALRRRFSFKEMAPKPELIETKGKSKGKIDNLNLVNLLKTINERIEKLIDKDHKIGHSYFLDVVTINELKLAFKDKIIPLLEEYFFGDFGKIGLVLGESFVKKVDVADFKFAKFEGYDSMVEQDLRQKVVYTIKDQKEWDFSSI